MCGIAGIYDSSNRRTTEELRADVGAMTLQIAHRGPDGHGAWADAEAGIALGHRRLSIIDLSTAGSQPMLSADGRYMLVFNGEIYNFERLRRELDAECGAISWQGHSDTEVLLEAISKWGLDATLRRTIGMFAFALWNRETRRLFLARDRAGEKPLYYGRCGSALLFGSELKALRAHPSFNRALSGKGAASFLRHGYVAGNDSIYAGIAKVPPGSYVTFDARAPVGAVTRYWSPPVPTPLAELSDPRNLDEKLEALLRDAIGLQTRADVPMGAFLSGGIDSSLITALMQAQSAQPVRSFSIGFHDASYNEANVASAVARHLGTEHHELYITPRDALDLIPALPRIYDEPFADVSQVPTCLLASLTRRHVTVCLSGDAGDELFGGYARYLYASRFGRLWNYPAWMRQGAAQAIGSMPPRLTERLSAALPSRLAASFRGDRLAKAVTALSAPDLAAVYDGLTTCWPDGHGLIRRTQEAVPRIDADLSGLRDAVSWMMARDFRGYLVDDILVKVDRAGMAASLESRIPFLDHRIIEFAAGISSRDAIRGGVGKLPLRRLLEKFVPAALLDRPKQGFGVPIADWLRGELRDWAESLLPKRDDDFLDFDRSRQAWASFIGGSPLHHQLWSLLMLQAWRNEYEISRG